MKQVALVTIETLNLLLNVFLSALSKFLGNAGGGAADPRTRHLEGISGSAELNHSGNLCYRNIKLINLVYHIYHLIVHASQLFM